MDKDRKPQRVSGGRFYDAITRAMSDDPRACFLSEYSAEEYKEMHCSLMGEHAGIAIDGRDIANVFNSQRNPVRGVLDVLIPHAVDLGATTLDCFGEKLRRIYEGFGFVAVAMVEFCDDKALNWDYDRFGRPPVYLMALQESLPPGVVSSELPILSYDKAYGYREKLLNDVQ